MTIDEVSNKIHVKEIALFEPNQTLFTAQLRIDRNHIVTNEAMEQVKDVASLKLNIHTRLREAILFELYEDRSQELYEALMNVVSCDHFDYERLNVARAKLINAAMHQPPCQVEK